MPTYTHACFHFLTRNFGWLFPLGGRKKIKEVKETGKKKGVSSEEEGKLRKKNRKGAGAKGGGKAAGAAPLAEAGTCYLSSQLSSFGLCFGSKKWIGI